MIGPFDPNIMPVTSRVRYDDVNNQWKVFASRYIARAPSGRRYEQLRSTFDEYSEALTAISVFFGNS